MKEDINRKCEQTRKKIENFKIEVSFTNLILYRQCVIVILRTTPHTTKEGKQKISSKNIISMLNQLLKKKTFRNSFTGLKMPKTNLTM